LALFTPSHGSRRGLYSYAASRLILVRAVVLSSRAPHELREAKLIKSRDLLLPVKNRFLDSAGSFALRTILLNSERQSIRESRLARLKACPDTNQIRQRFRLGELFPDRQQISWRARSSRNPNRRVQNDRLIAEG